MKHILYVCAVLLCAQFVGSCGKPGNGPVAGVDSTIIKNKAVNEAFYTAMSARDMEACVKLLDRSFVDHSTMPGQQPGVEGFRQMMGEMFSAFPDVHATILHVVAEGDMVATLSQMTGTNTGPFMAGKPTGKKIDVMGIDWVRIKNGKITEHWGYMDMGKFMSDLGMPTGMEPPSYGAAAKPPTKH